MIVLAVSATLKPGKRPRQPIGINDHGGKRRDDSIRVTLDQVR